MAGPAMIEGGGLGVVAAGAVGPMDVQTRNGVVDVLVADDAAAIAAAKQALSYFQGDARRPGRRPTSRRFATRCRQNRRRAYDVRAVVSHAGRRRTRCWSSAARHARNIVTALARLRGPARGDPREQLRSSQAGAITADAADKAARFLPLCNGFGLPVLSLCDTPGFMVGPDAERTGAGPPGRRAVRRWRAALRVPLVTVVLRKGYGLGAMAMAGGSFHATRATLAWPTGEFGGMNLEGAVRLGLRRELAAVSDPQEREQVYQEAVQAAYEHGKALSTATHLEVDDVIDPAATRERAVRVLFG